MALDPFEHVLDSSHWHIFESLEWEFHLPFGLTKFMVLELLAAGLMLAFYIPLANRARDGKPVRAPLWTPRGVLLTFPRKKFPNPCLGELDPPLFFPSRGTIFFFFFFPTLGGISPSRAPQPAS